MSTSHVPSAVITRNASGTFHLVLTWPNGSALDANFYTVADAVRTVRAEQDAAEEYDAQRTCNICDAVGHGYPGAGYCPIEERGYWEARADEERYGY